jgi:hypothetical protein
MSGICIAGIAIQFIDNRGRLIARHAQGVEKKMSTFGRDEHSLNDADIRVARAMGNDLKAVANIKYKHGRRGLAGVALHADGNPYGAPALRYKQTDPGRITDEGGVPVRTIVEPEDSDAEMVKDPAGLIVRPARVLFPNGTASN